jgi:hypothetical protein
MKKIYLLLMISTSCIASEPKYHLNDCVKVIEGFYRDCNGTVEAYIPPDKYEVVIVCKNHILPLQFRETDLVPSKSCE